MKKIIYFFFKKLSLLFLNISLLINSHKLCAFVILINIRRIKSIRSKSKNKKKILVFPKSGGNEDLIETYRNQKNVNITYFLLERIFLKKIFHYHFKNTDKSRFHADLFTKPSNLIEVKRKKINIQFLTHVFKIIDNFFKFDGYISFNIFYYNEKYLEEVFKVMNKKYIVLHKESVMSPIAEEKFLDIYKNKNERSLAYKISVYSQKIKKILIKSRVAKKKQIQVNGCPRTDYLYRLRKKKPRNEIIIFYLMEENHQLFKFLKIRKSLKKLQQQVLECLVKLGKENPKLKIILKGKTGVHQKHQFDLGSFPNNFTFIEGGPGEKFLEDAKVVIAFGSTIVFEAIASNRNLIVPNFTREYQLNKKLFIKVENKKYIANTKEQFLKKIKDYLNSNYKNKPLSNIDKRTLNYYLGNTDGKSGKRMREFLSRTIN